jgi:hypothetical protein
VKEKQQTAAQRIANPVWLRDQIRALVRDCNENIKEDQKLAAQARDDDRRKIYLERAASCQHWKRDLERILHGKTYEEDLLDFLEGINP